jgi:hypothetical protein
VQPLGSLTRNVWGGNLDIAALIDGIGLEMAVGEPRELLGFDEFDLDHVIKQFPSCSPASTRSCPRRSLCGNPDLRAVSGDVVCVPPSPGTPAGHHLVRTGKL